MSNSQRAFGNLSLFPRNPFDSTKQSSKNDQTVSAKPNQLGTPMTKNTRSSMTPPRQNPFSEISNTRSVWQNSTNETQYGFSSRETTSEHWAAVWSNQPEPANHSVCQSTTPQFPGFWQRNEPEPQQFTQGPLATWNSTQPPKQEQTVNFNWNPQPAFQYQPQETIGGWHNNQSMQNPMQYPNPNNFATIGYNTGPPVQYIPQYRLWVPPENILQRVAKVSPIKNIASLFNPHMVNNSVPMQLRGRFEIEPPREQLEWLKSRGQVEQETIQRGIQCFGDRLTQEQEAKLKIEEELLVEEQQEKSVRFETQPNITAHPGSSNCTPRSKKSNNGNAAAEENEYSTKQKPKELDMSRYTITPGCSDPDGQVKDLQISNEFGKILWPGSTNVTGLNFDSIVKISDRNVEVYPDEAIKPSQGEGLNKPAYVELQNIKPNPGVSVQDLDSLLRAY